MIHPSARRLDRLRYDVRKGSSNNAMYLIKACTKGPYLGSFKLDHLQPVKTIREAARGFESVFCNFRQRHSRNSSDSRFRAKRCVSDEISKASDLDMGDCGRNLMCILLFSCLRWNHWTVRWFLSSKRRGADLLLHTENVG